MIMIVLLPKFLLIFLLCLLTLLSSSSTSTSAESSVTTTKQTNLIHSSKKRRSKIVVVGSANVDTFLQVERLPVEGENIGLSDEGTHPNIDLPGGKGCTQAVAASKLLFGSGQNNKCVSFIGQLGNDEGGTIIKRALENSGVKISGGCTIHSDLPTGRGYVFITAQGKVSAVVSGGSNRYGWKVWENVWKKIKQKQREEIGNKSNLLDEEDVAELKLNELIDHDCKCIMLQREVPEYVNELIASYVAQCNAATSGGHNDDDDDDDDNVDDPIILIQDIGGDDRPISRQMLEQCDYIVPNETELYRLARTFGYDNDEVKPNDGNNHVNDDNEKEILNMILILQKNGARNVLVSRGSKGCLLVQEQKKHGNQQDDGSRAIIKQNALPVVSENGVVDETGAGDCFRAAFATALVENNIESHQEQKTIQRCLEFACAAGVCSVEKKGAVPSTPSRAAVEERLRFFYSMQQQRQHGQNNNDSSVPSSSVVEESVLKIPRGDGLLRPNPCNNIDVVEDVPRGGGDGGGGGGDADGDVDDKFPFLIGSRLNSMKDRPELWLNIRGQRRQLADPSDYVKRQGTIRELTCVDFNYPQHFHGASWWRSSSSSSSSSNDEMSNTLKDSATKAKAALDAEGLVAGAVCLRYPSPQFVRGAMNHPNIDVRQDAIRLTKEAAEVALYLGCNEVVVWSAYDGYDYPFQVNYDNKWDELIDAFQECCDAYPNVKFSLEFKPTDENTRFFTVPSTGAALLLAQEIDRPNFGLTMDVGHMLMAGENPGQSIAMVGRSKKLFGIQLNDGYTRLAAEDGMMFGSVHPAMALEIMYQLRRTGFDGHLYFDTFPQRTDPVREAEYNIKRVKAYWDAAGRIDAAHLKRIVDNHDAIGAIELVDESLRKM